MFAQVRELCLELVHDRRDLEEDGRTRSGFIFTISLSIPLTTLVMLPNTRRIATAAVLCIGNESRREGVHHLQLRLLCTRPYGPALLVD